MEYVKMETNHVTGIPESMGGSGDPSPVTAFGVYMGMKASAKFAYGSDSLNVRFCARHRTCWRKPSKLLIKEILQKLLFLIFMKKNSIRMC